MKTNKHAPYYQQAPATLRKVIKEILVIIIYTTRAKDYPFIGIYILFAQQERHLTFTNTEKKT